MPKRSEWTEREWLHRVNVTLAIGIFIGCCIGVIGCVLSHNLLWP